MNENIKNVKGDLGPICNYCGGFGFTNNMQSGSNGCPKCGGDGIEPVNVRELAKRVERLEEQVNLLLKEKNNV